MLTFAILFQLKDFYDYNPINLNLLYYYSPHQLTYLYIDKSLRSLNNYNPLTQTTTRYTLVFNIMQITNTGGTCSNPRTRLWEEMSSTIPTTVTTPTTLAAVVVVVAHMYVLYSLLVNIT